MKTSRWKAPLATLLGAAALALGAALLPACGETPSDLDDDSVDYTDDLADPDPDRGLDEDGTEPDPAFSSGGTDREFDGYEPLGEDVREAEEDLEAGQ